MLAIYLLHSVLDYSLKYSFPRLTDIGFLFPDVQWKNFGYSKKLINYDTSVK